MVVDARSRRPYMRKLIVSEFVTLDGVMEAPGGEPTHAHTGWVGPFFGPEIAAYKLNETLDAESLLLGRVTYESFAGAWPQREGPFAEKMNDMPKHVVSSTLRDLDWNNSSLLDGDVAGSVARLKQGAGGSILVAGSCRLVHSLLLGGLVDELRLMVFPVAIGSGLRVFPDTTEKLTLELADSRTLDAGVLAHTYRPVQT
jgi:dihydrofolate reductase